MIRNIVRMPKGNTKVYRCNRDKIEERRLSDYLKPFFTDRFMLFLMLVIIMPACGPGDKEPLSQAQFEELDVSSADELGVASGFTSQVLISSMDSLGPNTKFGYDVSGLAYSGDGTEGILWVNHELIKPMFTSGYYGDIARLRKQIEIERDAVGATALRVERTSKGWSYDIADGLHQRINAKEEIVLDETVMGKDRARGTTANKAAVHTSWNTFLSAEAGFDQYYGDYDYQTANYTPGIFRWASFFRDDPRLYGWIVETDLNTGEDRKLTDLGRAKRSGLALAEDQNNRILYFTSSSEDGYFFRYTGIKENWPSGGNLYVADLMTSKWIPLTLEQPKLRKLFDNPLEIRINLAIAAAAVGATTFDSPGGLAISPLDGRLYLATGNDLNTQNYHGSVMVFDIDRDDFSWDTIVEGGEDSGLSCPAELAFDQQGNLWIASAIPSQLMNKGAYTAYGNNALFVLEQGKRKPMRIANAPVDARFGGLMFTSDDQFLFVSVQQPGARSKSIWDFDFTSHWPEGGKAKPKSSVVVLSRE
ncbi:MAG: alkaline phosphatase PhoX [Bacteroidota bacterium]